MLFFHGSIAYASGIMKVYRLFVGRFVFLIMSMTIAMSAKVTMGVAIMEIISEALNEESLLHFA